MFVSNKIYTERLKKHGDPQSKPVTLPATLPFGPVSVGNALGKVVVLSGESALPAGIRRAELDPT